MDSSVVFLTPLTEEILIIQMCDKENKNAFSPKLINELQLAFTKIKEYPDCKVIILTGYGNYFSTGGSKEGLLALQQNQGTFQDADIYTITMMSPIPVISAIQGHAIGGGLIMGLFSDIVLLGKESIYSANFMKYGFTPGMGATYILPERLGIPLAQEMFYTSRNYRGEELYRRGVPFEVHPRDNVLPRAIELAKMIADKPRLTLELFKQHMTQQLRKNIQQVVEQELVMHSKTIHQSEVIERIEHLFGN